MLNYLRRLIDERIEPGAHSFNINTNHVEMTRNHGVLATTAHLSNDVSRRPPCSIQNTRLPYNSKAGRAHNRTMQQHCWRLIDDRSILEHVQSFSELSKAIPDIFTVMDSRNYAGRKHRLHFVASSNTQEQKNKKTPKQCAYCTRSRTLRCDLSCHPAHDDKNAIVY